MAPAGLQHLQSLGHRCGSVTIGRTSTVPPSFDYDWLVSVGLLATLARAEIRQALFREGVNLLGIRRQRTQMFASF